MDLGCSGVELVCHQMCSHFKSYSTLLLDSAALTVKLEDFESFKLKSLSF